MRTAIFAARYENLAAINEFVTQAAREADLSGDDIYSVELAIDEACTNIIKHAYQESPDGEIECTCSIEAGNLTVILRDHGRPFNPDLVAQPDLDSSLARRRAGGLGIFFMRHMMDEVRFENLGPAGNILTMLKRRKVAA